MLDEFHKDLCSVGVSAVSDTGLDGFLQAIEKSANEYMQTLKVFPCDTVL